VYASTSTTCNTRESTVSIPTKSCH
jgi:hypothetical protein